MSNKYNTVLYTGMTNDLERRNAEHKAGTFKNSFTKKYKVDKLIWYKQFFTPDEAIEAEKTIKGWTRDKKISLIEEVNPDWKDLSK